MSKIITYAMKNYTRGIARPREMWALTLLPISADHRGNERIMELLLDAVSETTLSISQILNQESDRKIPRWLPKEFARIIPTYRQFLRMLDRLEDGGAFSQRLAKYEEELLHQAHMGELSDIIDDPKRETRKTEFSMRVKFTGMLSKRRKDRGEADIVDIVVKESALKNMSNENLLKLNKMVTVEGTVDSDDESSKTDS